MLALVIAASGCGALSTPGGAASGANHPVTYALPPGNPPNYIFPFTPGNYFTNVNSANLQQLLYRPLYWYGTPEGAQGIQPTILNTKLSLADTPVYHGQQVTITMKHWRWSDNEPVSARDVLFWMHMLQAEKSEWGGYVAGAFPDNVGSVTARGNTITMDIKGPYSQEWFTDNELSQITPLPAAWDETAAGNSDCTNASGTLPLSQQNADCRAVWNYLNKQALNVATYAGSKIWTVVDGPWKLASVGAQGAGNWTFTYNGKYSGTLPPQHITTFVEEPFTSEQAEYNVLQAGGGNTIDFGYLPTVDAPVPPTGANVGANPVPGYRLSPLYTWGLDFFAYNFSNTTGAAPVFRQLYFRQAFQELINQAEIIGGPLHGYGKITTGPVGSYPVTSYLSAQARRGAPFTYDPANAAAVLKHHGWTVVPGGSTTCTSPGPGPGDCGPGIPRGKKLDFQLQYALGTDWVESAMKQVQFNDAQVGIQLTLQGEPVQTVLNNSYACTAAAKITSCPWELANWGGGWSYVPDFLPTGEELFLTGSESNSGNYSNLTNDKLIDATLRARTQAGLLTTMHTWENYLAGQLPVVMQPDAPYELIESIDGLHVGPQSSTLSVTPEDWYWEK